MWKKVMEGAGATCQSLHAACSSLPVHLFTRLAQFGVPSCRRKGCWYKRFYLSTYRCVLSLAVSFSHQRNIRFMFVSSSSSSSST